ncbi:hypothetical protein V3C99_015329 [Haemonchus contortus]
MARLSLAYFMFCLKVRMWQSRISFSTKSTEEIFCKVIDPLILLTSAIPNTCASTLRFHLRSLRSIQNWIRGPLPLD